MSKREESSIECGALWATVANPAPLKQMSKQRKKEHMAAKKTKKTKPKRPHHHAHAAHRPHKSNPAPAGMVLVPASMLDRVTNPAPKKRKKHHHHGKHPHKKNPGPEETKHSHMKDAAIAIGLGALAATAGLAGGYLLSKAPLKSKGANVAANLVTGAAIGGALGMLDRTAGVVVAHNYAVAAGQWLTFDPATQARRPQGGPGQVTVTAARPSMPDLVHRQMATKPTAFHGADEMDGYEKLEGVVVDTMGEPSDVEGYEKLEGVVADSMGAADDVDGFERLDGIVADDMGDSDELGEEEVGDAEDVGDSDYFG